MSDLDVLIGEIGKNIQILGRIRDFEERTELEELKQTGKTKASALMMASIIENYYTCLETLFLRISQSFENNLAEHRWHGDLLEKMTIHVPGIRERVITDETYGILLEFMRFRHFKRYYFELEYDWDKIDFLLRKLKQVHPLVLRDIKRFMDFLKAAQDSRNP
jgi:hypothetical protein